MNVWQQSMGAVPSCRMLVSSEVNSVVLYNAVHMVKRFDQFPDATRTMMYVL
jgi:hypothetical protein